MDSPIRYTGGSEDPVINDMYQTVINDMYQTFFSWSDSGSCCNSSNLEHFSDITEFWSFMAYGTYLIRDRHGDKYSIYFDIENKIIGVDGDSLFLKLLNDDNTFLNLNELEKLYYRYIHYILGGSENPNRYYYHCMYDTQLSWNSYINSYVDCYLHLKIGINSYISGGTHNYSDNYVYTFITNESISGSKNRNSSVRTRVNGTDFNIRGRSNDFDINKKYRSLWIQCENCYGLNYKKFFTSKLNICEQCGYHLKMTSSERIELLIDPGTWDPLDENMVSADPIEFHSEEEPYRDRIDFSQRKTGLTEAVQTGIGQLDGIPIAIGVMDFQFMGGSMGSVVGEKITRLIEYATNQSLPVIIICASGGARMQEGSLSLMQMAKISSALYNYQLNKKLFYVSILASPTTGGVTASFGMLGDIIIAEPNAYIAFAGKRVIEQTLNKAIPDGSQAAEYSFHKGLFDPIVPRSLLKGVLGELCQLHGFLPLTKNCQN